MSSVLSTTAQAVKILNISKVRLNELARKGKIPRGPGPNQWDIDAIRKATGNNLDIRQASRVRGDVISFEAHDEESVPRGTLAHAQLKKLQAQASIEQSKAKLMDGSLVSIPDINAYMAGCIVKARDTLLRIGPELRDRIAQESDPIKCDGMITAEIVRGLREISEYRPNAS